MIDVMTVNLFKCANTNCAYAIDSEGLNKIQLQVLRRWAKTCPKCGELTKWLEQTSLLKTNNQNKTNGGSYHATPNQTVSKTESQKRRSARHDGSH